MMIRRYLMTGLLVAAFLPTCAMAQDYATQIQRQLRQQGYSDIDVSSTLLGRIRIVARTGDGTREIIINPGTGEILRDLFTGSRGSGSQIINGGGGSGGGSNSGSGSGGGSNSGGGGSGGGSGGDGGDDDDGGGSGGDDDDGNSGSGGGDDNGDDDDDDDDDDSK